MLTIDEKIKITEEKIINIKKSIQYAQLTLEIESNTGSKDQILDLILKQNRAIGYFNNILNGLKNEIDQA
jgi:hypothetical protein